MATKWTCQKYVYLKVSLLLYLYEKMGIRWTYCTFSQGEEMLYALNLYSAVRQLFLKKTEQKKLKTKKNSSRINLH